MHHTHASGSPELCHPTELGKLGAWTNAAWIAGHTHTTRTHTTACTHWHKHNTQSMALFDEDFLQTVMAQMWAGLDQSLKGGEKTEQEDHDTAYEPGPGPVTDNHHMLRLTHPPTHGHALHMYTTTASECVCTGKFHARARASRALCVAGSVVLSKTDRRSSAIGLCQVWLIMMLLIFIVMVKQNVNFNNALQRGVCVCCVCDSEALCKCVCAH